MGKVVIIKGANFSVNAIEQIPLEPSIPVTLTQMASGLLHYYVSEQNGAYTPSDSQLAYYLQVTQGERIKVIFQKSQQSGLTMPQRYGFYQNMPSEGAISPDHGVNTIEGTASGTVIESDIFTAPFNGYFIISRYEASYGIVPEQVFTDR